MRIEERVSLGANGVAGQVVLTTFEGETITIRAADISAVEAMSPDARSPVYTGVRCMALWNGRSRIVRDTAANVLSAIDAAVTTSTRVFKFGRALDCDSAIPTDVWDGADGVTSTDIWVPPTAARIHNIVSTAAADADPAGTGLRTLRVSGLTSWAASEVSEDVVMNGVGPVATVNAYVVIHRMRGLTFGSGQTNAGIITATAAADATITAAIQAGQSQTQMAIYAVPSTQTLLVTMEDVSAIAGTGPAVNVDVSFMVLENAGTLEAGWVVKNTYRVTGADAWHQEHKPEIPFPGPLIAKIQVLADTNNSVLTASFNALLVDN